MSVYVRVYQLNGIHFQFGHEGCTWGIPDPSKRAADGSMPVVPQTSAPTWDDFRLVATLDFDFDEGVNLPQMLQAAHEKTNTVECNWWDNEGIALLVEGGARSTTVGDRMVVMGGVYEVTGLGFARIHVCSAHFGRLCWLV